ncbi:membrane protease YdiL (CAAX protease family) [Prauserella sediminis]|uniref:Membrane protease YdiL (CAAX protease family) n=1 Tax=Prauserella sediminis TaxID=577680 RepID=A0A839XLF8_9PSEU|nr:CPBP family intramembrane glutamic endopeptidase [Prauserella sediminis]MBB3664090.1 membrane protease YdiL (CAAX protease family) [Prauserella sediminis]
MSEPCAGVFAGTLELVLTDDAMPVAHRDSPSAAYRAYLALEFLALFFGIIAAFAVLADGVSPVPFLVVLGIASVVYLLRVGEFDRRDLWRASAVRARLLSILGLWAAACVVAVAGVAVFLPGDLFSLPRGEPVLWAIIAVGYPVLSVYPQELIFRAFLFRRYRPVFGSGAGMILASAAAFGFAHIIFGNLFAVLATTAGGLLFAWRYARSRSLLAVSIEHGLYGVLLFTVGLGRFVYHGAG